VSQDRMPPGTYDGVEETISKYDELLPYPGVLLRSEFILYFHHYVLYLSTSLSDPGQLDSKYS
jgi:hypothetical protein